MILSNGGKKRQRRGRTTQHTRPMAINTTMDLGHINGIGQHFSLDVSCVRLNCSRGSNHVWKEKNPIRRVQDLMGWYQAWRQSVCTHVTFPLHTHAHSHQTNKQDPVQGERPIDLAAQPEGQRSALPVSAGSPSWDPQQNWDTS